MAKYLDINGTQYLVSKITANLETKQDDLTAGDNISIVDNVISCNLNGLATETYVNNIIGFVLDKEY